MNVTQYDNDAPLVKQGRNCSLIPITCVGRSRNLLQTTRTTQYSHLLFNQLRSKGCNIEGRFGGELTKIKEII